MRLFMNIGKLLMAAAAALVSAAGLAAQENTVRFAFFSDTHYSEGSGAVRDLSRCVKDVNTLDNLDFVLVGGDLTDFGTDEEIAAVKQILDSLRYKYYVVAGNARNGCLSA